MTRFLFWNLHRADATAEPKRAAAICASLARLVRDRGIDILIFAEYELADTQVKTALDASGVGVFHRPASRSERIVIWTRWPVGRVVDRYGGWATTKMTIRQLVPSNGIPAHLVAAHLRDRTTLTTEAGRGHAASEVSAAIRRFESFNGNGRTILVGDLNLNPFEFGAVGPACFHAMMTTELARSVQGLAARSDYSTFYNPMWGLFGDRTKGPPGTYFWRNSEEATNHFWHMYDQVLIRPDLIDSFRGVEIVAGDGTESFVTDSGRPRPDHYSDHLPLLFEIDFTR